MAEPFDFKGKIAREVLREVRLDRGMVLRVLKNLDPSKTSGPDGMHPKVLVEVAEEVAEPIYMIYEFSLLTSSIPDYWEVANITSIFKGGDRKDPGNYRPVSLTSLLFLDILQLFYSLHYTSFPFLKGCRLEKGHIVPVLCSHS